MPSPSAHRIRLAAIADIPGILAIANRAAAETSANFAAEPEPLPMWEDDWSRTHERYPWFVALDDDGTSVIAFAKASPHRGRCAYAYSAEVTVYVDPRHHRRGLGRTLYRQLIQTLERQGYVTLLAGIALPNPASIALHESFGFRRIGVFEKVGWKFDTWHDVGYWQLTLREGDDPPGEIAPTAESRNIES